MPAVESEGDDLPTGADHLLGPLSLIVGKVEFLHLHRDEVDDDLADQWLGDIEAIAQELSTYFGWMARGALPHLSAV